MPETSQSPTALRSVLVIGSGPIVIGQAAEFDYSGTQACLACREAGVRTILVNSNPATIQTDAHVADTVYIEPLTVDSVERIIARERPDGIIATVGGQTALNLAVALDEAGVLARWDVALLGTGLDAIRRGEDRALFAETLRQASQPLLPSEAITSIEEALEVAGTLGYPVMCRSAYALGGAGSGFAADPDELVRQVELGLRASGSGQVLIEKSVYGWTEVEYEVVRDAAGNCLVVCNMENIDPMGVHTGDSIVVAPSQTLSDGEYHTLRTAAIRIVDALGVEGGCNVQFALERTGGQYYVIKVNPRLSRSSALASKATGYPIAKVATRIALGFDLPQITNEITGTSAFFEPALDYVVVKIPRWPFDKFAVPTTISTSMRSTGEVMAIGRTFQEAMAKAIRSIDSKAVRLPDDLAPLLARPNGLRLWALLAALRQGWDPANVAELTAIHPWFIERLAMNDGAAPLTTSYKMVDTCAAEFEARTPYFYGTDGGENEAQPLPGPKAIILGAGPIRIGQGIEFDYATVHACNALRAAGVRPIIINNNPETVSTDYTTSDRLYFEPLDIDSVMAVIENEREGLLGVIPQFGGQTALNLVAGLHQRGVPILGTPPEWIDAAENRRRTSAILTTARIPAPAWRAADRWERVMPMVEAVGFPVLLRPSYVLSGEGMTIARNRGDVEAYIERHGHTPLATPLLIDHFLEGAVELNVEAVFDGRDIVTVVMEQIDECGVHSGDSVEVYPTQTIAPDILETVQRRTLDLARAFNILGLMNVQYAIHDGIAYVLEINARASRSVPFASKASGIPLADLAIQVIMGGKLREIDVPPAITNRICVKNVVLPFRIFPTMDPLLGPQMQSTGESMGVGATFGEAYWKAWQGAGMLRLPYGERILLRGLDADEDAVLRSHLAAAGCVVVDSAEDLADIALVVSHGTTLEERDVLRQAAARAIPAITTYGSIAALGRALAESSGSAPVLSAQPV